MNMTSGSGELMQEARVDRGPPSPVFFKPKPKVRVLPPGVMPVMTQGLDGEDSPMRKTVVPPVEDAPAQDDEIMEYSEPSHNPFAFIQVIFFIYFHDLVENTTLSPSNLQTSTVPSSPSLIPFLLIPGCEEW